MVLKTMTGIVAVALFLFLGLCPANSIDNDCWYDNPEDPFGFCNWGLVIQATGYPWCDYIGGYSYPGLPGEYHIVLWLVNYEGVPISGCDTDIGNGHSRIWMSDGWVVRDRSWFQVWDTCDGQRTKRLLWCHDGATEPYPEVTAGEGGTAWGAEIIKEMIKDDDQYIDFPIYPDVYNPEDGVEFMWYGICEE